MAEFDQDHANADEKDADGATAQTAVKTLFVMIKSLPRIAHGRDPR